MASPVGIVIFIVATLAKSFEPLSVALAARGQPLLNLPLFSAVLVVAEASKLAAASLTVCLTGECSMLTFECALLTIDSLYRFGPPALFLTLANQGLGYAIPRLDPMLYQTLFKGVNVMATALLSSYRRPLGWIRWISLLLLLLGCLLAVPQAESYTSSTSEGLLVTIAGALCMAMQAVWLESDVREGESAAWQTTSLAFWGLMANVLLLGLSSSSWLASHQYNPFDGFEMLTWVAGLTIGFTDLTMVIFYRHLGSNAYSFSRVFAMILCTAMTVAILHRPLTGQFVAGTSIVFCSAWLYQRYDPTAAAGYRYDAVAPSDDLGGVAALPTAMPQRGTTLDRQ